MGTGIGIGIGAEAEAGAEVGTAREEGREEKRKEEGRGARGRSPSSGEEEVAARVILGAKRPFELNRPAVVEACFPTRGLDSL